MIRAARSLQKHSCMIRCPGSQWQVRDAVRQVDALRTVRGDVRRCSGADNISTAFAVHSYALAKDVPTKSPLQLNYTHHPLRRLRLHHHLSRRPHDRKIHSCLCPMMALSIRYAAHSPVRSTYTQAGLYGQVAAW